jgi:hypothetical protein
MGKIREDIWWHPHDVVRLRVSAYFRPKASPWRFPGPLMAVLGMSLGD